MQITKLSCEYMVDPLGIDCRQPRLTWELSAPERGASQSGYRVLVASSDQLLSRDQGDLWDTGYVVGNQSTLLRYAGKSLEPRQRYYWKVMVWDQVGAPSSWSHNAVFEMGLMSQRDWEGAQWLRIAKDTRASAHAKRALQAEHMDQPVDFLSHPSPLFRKVFRVQGKVARARAYVCGVGYQELYLNGARIGDSVLDPGQTTYDVRALYVTYDITANLHQGDNALGVMLGNGFYGQNMAFTVEWLGWGPPAFIAKVMIDYDDRRSETIVSDKQWRAETGPVLYDNVYGGETYDARRERIGWNLADYDDSGWQHAKQVDTVSSKLIAQALPPIKRIRAVTPQSVLQVGDKRWIIDLGQNIAGWMRIRVNEPAGTEITMRHAELLSPDGKAIDPASTGVFATGVVQTCIYICKGGGEETWEPRFTYHGFRYVEVSGLSTAPTPQTFQGVLVRSSVEKHGDFACSDELLNRIYQTSMWTIEDNLHSTSEDCPHREKCGWLGDAHVVGETDIFNFDMAQFWAKYMDDIETTAGRGGQTYWGQAATPGIPCNIAVGRRLCEEARPDWGVAVVLVPWYLYLYYGDIKPIEDHLPLMQRWIEYVNGLREEGIVVRGYGDWCPPGTNELMECPVELSSTAYHYGTLKIMARISQLVARPDDAARYAAEAADTHKAFNKRFRQPDGGYGCQTADALALRFGLAPEGSEDEVARALVKQVVERHKGHYNVGIHGGRPIYSALNDHGYEQVVWNMMHKRDYPSYGYIFDQGFTTWPEEPNEWKAGEPKPKCSYNHPMHAGFAAWFHESVGGIRPDPEAPGFKHFLLHPHHWRHLCSAEATHQTLYGRISSRWHNVGEVVIWEVSIPANTTATARIPARNAACVTESALPLCQAQGIHIAKQDGEHLVFDLQSGDYRFEVAG